MWSDRVLNSRKDRLPEEAILERYPYSYQCQRFVQWR
jgi:hypothetical protein